MNKNINFVHKVGDVEDAGNFNPMSVVLIEAKVLEKLVTKQLGYFSSVIIY